jgi:hypothetical protein
MQFCFRIYLIINAILSAISDDVHSVSPSGNAIVVVKNSTSACRKQLNILNVIFSKYFLLIIYL